MRAGPRATSNRSDPPGAAAGQAARRPGASAGARSTAPQVRGVGRGGAGVRSPQPPVGPRGPDRSRDRRPGRSLHTGRAAGRGLRVLAGQPVRDHRRVAAERQLMAAGAGRRDVRQQARPPEEPCRSRNRGRTEGDFAPPRVQEPPMPRRQQPVAVRQAAPEGIARDSDRAQGRVRGQRATDEVPPGPPGKTRHAAVGRAGAVARAQRLDPPLPAGRADPGACDDTDPDRRIGGVDRVAPARAGRDGVHRRERSGTVGDAPEPLAVRRHDHHDRLAAQIDAARVRPCRVVAEGAPTGAP